MCEVCDQVLLLVTPTCKLSLLWWLVCLQCTLPIISNFIFIGEIELFLFVYPIPGMYLVFPGRITPQFFSAKRGHLS